MTFLIGNSVYIEEMSWYKYGGSMSRLFLGNLD